MRKTHLDMPNDKSAKLYRSVKLVSLGNRRRGKHHDLTEGILRELRLLKDGLALVIPLAGAGVELANLRSAVHRAAAADDLNVETQADEKNFYVWVRQGPNGRAESQKKPA